MVSEPAVIPECYDSEVTQSNSLPINVGASKGNFHATSEETHPGTLPTPRRPTPLPHKCLRLTFLRILGNLGNQALCLA